jgi:hypothetical protein
VATLPDGVLSKQTAFKYMQTAQRADELTAAGVDASQFSDTAFRSVVKETSAADFVAVVESMLAVEDPKLTASAFTEAGRKAGIVAAANNGSGPEDSFVKAINGFLSEAGKAGDRKLSKADIGQLESVVEIAKALLS